jgi:hypothetical protein
MGSSKKPGKQTGGGSSRGPRTAPVYNTFKALREEYNMVDNTKSAEGTPSKPESSAATAAAKEHPESSGDYGYGAFQGPDSDFHNENAERYARDTAAMNSTGEGKTYISC